MKIITAVLLLVAIGACALTPSESTMEQDLCQIQDQGVFCGGPFPQQLAATWAWTYGNTNVVQKIDGGCTAVSMYHTICWAVVDTPVGDLTVTCDFSIVAGNVCEVGVAI